MRLQELSEARLAVEGLRAAQQRSEASSAGAAAALSEREDCVRQARSALGERAREVGELRGQLAATQAERDQALECVAAMQSKVRQQSCHCRLPRRHADDLTELLFGGILCVKARARVLSATCRAAL